MSQNLNKIDRLIRTGDDPILKAVCREIEPGENISHIIDRLHRVVRKASRAAAGLAAPQVGYDRRVIITYCRKNNDGPVQARIMINPVIKAYSDKKVVEREGCLSYPVAADKPIERSWSIDVTWETELRQPRYGTFIGFEARVIQHEVDHLQGICLVGDPNYVAHTPEELREMRAAREARVAEYPGQPRRGSAIGLSLAMVSLAMAGYGVSGGRRR